MSILSDKEIKERCLPPTAIVTFNGVRSFSHLTIEQVNAVNEKQFGNSNLRAVTSEYKTSKDLIDKFWLFWESISKEDLALFKPMISPFESFQIKAKGGNLTSPPPDAPEPDFGEMVSWRTPIEKLVSYGTSSYGYDLRAGFKYKIFTNVNSAIVDPKGLDTKSFVDVECKEGETIIIPPNSFLLTHSLEHMSIPKNVTGVVLGKSTYARCGVNCLATPLEAGWEGYVTLEFTNGTPLPVRFYPGEGCCQVLFFEGSQNCEVSYADRNGKYMNQPAEVVLPKV